MNKKDKNLIEKAERRGIPIFVMSADDKCALQTMLRYQVACLKAGCNNTHTDGVTDRIAEFQSWQEANPDQVKLPD